MDSELIKSFGINIIHLTRLYHIVEMATQFYHRLLTPNSNAFMYLNRRGYLPSTIAKFRLGYAPKTASALRNYLLKKGFTDVELELAGLVINSYDVFRNRIMIPISESSGRVVGFGARVIDDSEPKYINSPQSTIFHKSYLLYGLYQAKDAIRQSGQAVITEGYMDVLTAHQYGFMNVVSNMGAAISEPQIRLLRRLAREIIVAFDGDVGGDVALLEFTKRYLRGDYDETGNEEMVAKVPDSF